MSKQSIPFLDLFMKYCEHSFDKENALKVYTYFLEKSEFISATIRCNETLSEDCFMEVRYILQQMEADIFKNDIPIYYVKCPYDANTFNRVSFKDFLKNTYDFFAEKGHPSHGELRSTRLEFDVKILPFVYAKSVHEKSIAGNLGHPRYWHNHYNQRQDDLFALIYADKEKILQKHGKSFQELTREQFTTYVEKSLNQDDGQHIVEPLWYRMRKD
jgi:hypothetical protein